MRRSAEVRTTRADGSVRGDMAEELARMAVELHDKDSVVETVDGVLSYALGALQCEYAGVIFVHSSGRIETVATTDPLVADLDAFQLEHGQGPDIDMMSEHHGVMVSDTHAERRWPAWAVHVAEAGIRSMIGVRLYTDSTTIGTLNFYDPVPGRFDIADQQVAHVLARHAAVALSSSRNTENLWRAIDSRKRIGQAQGFLMARYHLTEDQAFAVLVRYSQNSNIKLREVAERVIEGGGLPEPPRSAGDESATPQVPGPLPLVD